MGISEENADFWQDTTHIGVLDYMEIQKYQVLGDLQSRPEQRKPASNKRAHFPHGDVFVDQKHSFLHGFKCTQIYQLLPFPCRAGFALPHKAILPSQGRSSITPTLNIRTMFEVPQAQGGARCWRIDQVVYPRGTLSKKPRGA